MKDWINWKTILTSAAGLIVTALLTGAGVKMKAEYATYQDVKKEVAQNKMAHAEFQETSKIIKQMAGDVAAIRKQMMTVTGKAVVRDLEGRCMQVNVTGRAGAYAKIDRARITNMSSVEMPSVVVKIEGTFTHADENNVAIISKQVGNLIDAKPGAPFNIRIEPVEEAK